MRDLGEGAILKVLSDFCTHFNFPQQEGGKFKFLDTVYRG